MLEHVNKVFAELNDGDLIEDLSTKLSMLVESQGDHVIDSWPESWRVVWVMDLVLGWWEGEGIGAVWLLGEDVWDLFLRACECIGEGSVVAFFQKSMNEVGCGRLQNEAFISGDEFGKLADYWTGQLGHFVDPIKENLARFARCNRMDFCELIA